MGRGVLFSGVLHLALAALAYFGLPDLFEGEIQMEHPIPVEVVTIADETNAPPPEPAPEPEAEPDRPRPMPTVEEQPPPPPPPEPEVAEAPPPPPEAAPEPKPEPPPEPEPEVAAVPPQPKPEPPLRTKIRPKPRPRQPDQLATLLRNVEKLKDSIQQKEPPPEQPPPETKAPRRPPVEYDPSRKITISERDAIRRHFEQCWNVPAGAREAENLVVEVQVRVNPDGWVREARILDTARTARDPFFRAAAESARRAILNPACRSLKALNLPVEKYELWKDMKISFNPKELLGS